MNKRTTKKNNYNKPAVDALILKYGVSKRFVHQSINNERDSLTAESIRKDYADLVRPTLKKIEQFKNQ